MSKKKQNSPYTRKKGVTSRDKQFIREQGRADKRCRLCGGKRPLNTLHVCDSCEKKQHGGS